ncbi:MAG: macrolide ABC transporter ATP-binding protein [Chloroflexi bacterium RBG_19FT_COMBO_56_12]|mgnify:CR=1 FL=1|nr:MAG: macrolide ABC transporter ATP-binding protein [Chloroflexi bacterium RBG_19FT_COMBO_56_12]
MIEVQDITKTYRLGSVEVPALCGVSFRIERGEVVAIMGQSGSGKSTLMNILGCLDLPTSGQYYLDGKNIAGMNEDELATIRNQKVGFVFQMFNLLPRMTVLRNAELPLMYNGRHQYKEARQRAEAILNAVGLADRMNHRPTELSGGQQQRVAIARALINEPALILADEPTGNLDSSTGAEIISLLLGLNKERGLTLVIVTHDSTIASQAQRVIRLRDGLIENGGGGLSHEIL